MPRETQTTLRAALMRCRAELHGPVEFDRESTTVRVGDIRALVGEIERLRGICDIARALHAEKHLSDAGLHRILEAVNGD